MKRAAGALLTLTLGTSVARAQPTSPHPTATAPATSASASTATSSPANVGGCVETIPSGSTHPTLTEIFPTRGFSGYEATLHVVVDHGKGESVLPHGLELQSENEAAKALRSAGFVLPNQDGGAHARLSTTSPDPKHPERSVTTLDLPLVPLPAEPGRHTLVLPPLPIAVARASGDLATVCTREHTLVVDDPTASTPDAQPKPNPSPRPQREEWTALRQVLTWLAVGSVVGAIVAYFVRKWMQRPRPVPPPPPPRPPWDIALEHLDEVRYAGLLEVGRFQEYFDRVNDAVRRYLGARFGFDGLESTTDEIVHELRRTLGSGSEQDPASHATAQAFAALPRVVEFLTECDLVKFANVIPTQTECEGTLVAAENIVRSTMPGVGRSPQASSPAPTPAPPIGRPAPGNEPHEKRRNEDREGSP